MAIDFEASTLQAQKMEGSKKKKLTQQKLKNSVYTADDD